MADCWCPCGAWVSLAAEHAVVVVHPAGFEDVRFCSAACKAAWVEAWDADEASRVLADGPAMAWVVDP